MLPEVRGGLRQDVGAGAGGDVVEDAGQVRRLRDRGVVGDETLLGGLVVVGRDQKQAVRAERLRLLRHHDRVGGVVGAGSGDDRDPAGGLLHAEADRLKVLVVVERRRLTGRSDRDDRICMICNLKLNEISESLIVDASVFVHRRHDGDAGAFENCHGFTSAIYL